MSNVSFSYSRSGSETRGSGVELGGLTESSSDESDSSLSSLHTTTAPPRGSSPCLRATDACPRSKFELVPAHAGVYAYSGLAFHEEKVLHVNVLGVF